MEISELNIISNFEAGVNCLQNPSLVSRFFSLSVSAVGELPKTYSFLKWGALILAFFATFSAMITRIKLLIVRFCGVTLLSSSESPTQQLQYGYRYDEDEDENDDEDEDDSGSPALSDDEEYRPTTSFRSPQPIGDDFCVAGSSCNRSNQQWQSRNTKLRRRTGADHLFSWSDLAVGKSVVKLWDSLGLGLDFEENSSGNVVSVCDLNDDQKISSFPGRGINIPFYTSSTPTPVIFSAGSKINSNGFLAVYDTRVGSRIPAIYAEWLPRRGKVVGINLGGVDKVYVRNEYTGVMTVGDMRKVQSPLENLTESDGYTWWNADAVTISSEFVDDSARWGI
ncbi:hypothetical protein U1Q18_002283 [Sarracenia purpurea var. burkii]